MTLNLNWTCPYCHHPQVVSDGNYSQGFRALYVGKNKYNDIGLTSIAIACQNQDCREVFLRVLLTERKSNRTGPDQQGNVIETYNLKPESSAKVFPEFIPAPLRQDYLEACRIKNLSPKASATLSRRCLQGAIRDFCNISRPTLDAEIKALVELLDGGNGPPGVTAESVEAIDHVRKIGNIGAHMEKDINVIIDIDEGEAQALIELIEVVFEDWYIGREKRQARLARVKLIRDEKDAMKEGARS